MKALQRTRERCGLSQRNLATIAGVSYKTIQLIESGKHDPQLSTLTKLSSALGYPHQEIDRCIESLFEHPVDSLFIISEHIAREDEASWKTWLFNFVDAFRATKAVALIDAPPSKKLSPRMSALMASTVEALCVELSVNPPLWCDAIPPLDEPWFVAEIENLVPMALVESSVYFRKRNIFVLENFLERK